MTKPRKIAILLPRLYGGGAEKMALDIACLASQRDFEITVCCLKETLPAFEYLKERLRQAGVSLVTLGGEKRLGPRAFFRLVRWLREHKPDIIHTHLFGADLFGTLAGRVARIPVIISTEHNLNLSEGWVKRQLKKVCARLRTKTIAVSETVLEYAVRYEGVNRKKAAVIYNGVEVPTRPGIREARTELRVGAVGRLTEQKNFASLIRAMPRIKNASLTCTIAGEGEERPGLEKLIKELEAEQTVRLVGWQKDISAFFESIDIFVLPSKWEGHPLAVLEAGAHGVPVLAADIPSVREIIRDGAEGLIFKDDADLVRQLEKLASDTALRQRLGAALYEIVSARFSLLRMVENYQALYLETLSSYGTDV